MISLASNIVALFISIWLPFSETSYISGQRHDLDICNQRNEVLEVEAQSFAILTPDNSLWLSEKNGLNQQAIASITKIMTALVFLDNNPGWDLDYTIKREDLVSGGRVHLFLGDTVKLRDLFKTALIASDNGAALALARSTGLSDEQFITEMNKKAFDLGLMQSNFVDPTGLSSDNISNAKDVARLARVALYQDDIAEAISYANYSFRTQQGRLKFLESTDLLIENQDNSSFKSLGGKTGYTEAAGYSFVARFQDEMNRDLIVVVLNSGGRNDRFAQAQNLAAWAFNHCSW